MALNNKGRNRWHGAPPKEYCCCRHYPRIVILCIACLRWDRRIRRVEARRAAR